MIKPAKANCIENLQKHVALIGFKPATSSKQIALVLKTFADLAKKIHAIRHLDGGGVNNSPEHLNQGFQYGFILTFSSKKDRDDYLVNPYHLAFVKLAKKNGMDRVLVFDFITKTNTC